MIHAKLFSRRSRRISWAMVGTIVRYIIIAACIAMFGLDLATWLSTPSVH